MVSTTLVAATARVLSNQSHYDNNYAKLKMYNSYLANISILTMLTAHIAIFVWSLARSKV